MNYNLIAKGYKYFDIGNKYVYYSNSTNKPVITNLKVFEEKMCMDKSYSYTKYIQYILDRKFSKYGCKNKFNGELYDNNIQELDSKTKKEFYEETDEGIINQYKSSYFGYPFQSLNAKMILYPKRFIGFNKECLLKIKAFEKDNNPFDKQNIMKTDEIFNSYFEYKGFFMVWNPLSFGFALFSANIIFFIDINNCKIFLIWAIMNFIPSLVIGWNFSSWVLNMKYLKDFPLCSNDLINSKIKFYNSNNSKLKVITYISGVPLFVT